MTQTQGGVLVAFGASLAWLGAPPARTVQAAARSLARFGPLTLSPLYDSPAWPDPAAPPYVNAVARWAPTLGPRAALAALLATEAAFGRRRGSANAPRTLDLDLLAHGDQVRDGEDLTLPHPRLSERDFVLLPLRDVAPGWRHPVTGRTVEALIGALPTTAALQRAGSPVDQGAANRGGRPAP